VSEKEPKNTSLGGRRGSIPEIPVFLVFANIFGEAGKNAGRKGAKE